ncbi:MAG: hypothetical protein ACYSWP_04060 [Planctomycetota bacterium]|jgi:hypothetical protein
MPFIRIRLFLITALLTTPAWALRKPNIGYLYPAGAQRGKTVIITAGGQFLRGPTDVYISGKGVRASVIKYVKPIGNLNKDKRLMLKKRFKEVMDKRLAKLPRSDRNRPLPRKRKPIKKPAADKKDAKIKNVDMPDHPMLHNLEQKSIRELQHIKTLILESRRKRQPNRQIAESVLIEVTIDADTEPGNRELRIATKTGMTNPIVFQVGSVPEVRELEPNNKQAYPAFPKIPDLPRPKPVDLPVVLNGQIMPGDIDRFSFHARRGQELVIDAHARSLIPYLADAVPGWFQATVALYDSEGKEVAFADDYRFNPDPVLFYKIPRNGQYELQIRDSIYRGREDFIYRIAVGRQPFITRMFPLGARFGTKTTAAIDGWNLPKKRLTLDIKPGDESIRHVSCKKGKSVSNSIPYAVDLLPQCDEAASNDTIETAQLVELPININGRINKTGDKDIFGFKGRAGDKIVAEVYARRLNSPLDSLLRLTDESQNIIAWNDDHVIKDNHLHKDTSGLITHHADSYLIAKLPEDGTYYVHLTDSQNNAGPAHAYRLGISAPKPDFAIRLIPSSIYANAGATVPVTVHALRKDGFEGEIELKLKDTSSGFKLNGGRIPAGRDHIRMTLTAPPKATDQPVNLKLQALAKINGQTLTRKVVPADDVMQAFLYRHLVPAKQFLVSVRKARRSMPLIRLTNSSPVRLIAGGSTKVRMKIPKRRGLGKKIQLQLSKPPEGLKLHNVKILSGSLEFEIQADRDKTKSGFADNIIIEAFREFTPKQKGKNPKKKKRVSIDFLPAIPIQIVN